MLCPILFNCSHSHSSLTNTMDDLLSEIMDSPGEIYDVIEYKEEYEEEEKFNVENFINSNIDY